MNVLFVHGYSETSLSAYFDFPQRLQAAMTAAGAPINQIVVSAYNSLDDTVTIDDLAVAMEDRVAVLAPGFVPDAIVCHSTGALVARRWILNRLSAGGAIPSHLITIAGANHGSTLAQMGKSVLGYVQKLFVDQTPSVGANVLTDLDYGSDFLLKLNAEWIDRWNDGSLDGLFAFSMGGDSVGNDPKLDIFWQTHEPGSDNTVRISGANLNFTIIEVTHGPAGVVPTAKTPVRPVPHVVLTGYSHFGPATGILGWVNPTGDAPVNAVVEALRVGNLAQYTACATRWSGTTAACSAAANAAHVAPNGPPSSVNSTIVFTMKDESGRSIDDCVITILNQAAIGPQATDVAAATVAQTVVAANRVSDAIMPHSPIQNNVQQGSYSFYFDYNEYTTTSPHWFHAEAALAGGLVVYIPLTFMQPQGLFHTINPNEFTYVSLTMKRFADNTYALYRLDPQQALPLGKWMPFPDGRIS